MLLVSACLIGLNTKYSGENNLITGLLRLAGAKELVPVCPEQLGGLSTPRTPAEIRGGTGPEVLAGLARVITAEGIDVTLEFVRGAESVLYLARILGVRGAILKERSPSCGVKQIYDGTYSRILRPGLGVTTALLKSHGILVISEEDYCELGLPEGMEK
ncbi:MAG: DUF523 domain-containing protein [Bacillota bacterium]